MGMKTIERKMGGRGDLAARVIRAGESAEMGDVLRPVNWWTAGGKLPLSIRARTVRKEFALRCRLAAKGFVRGWCGTGIIGVSRLYGTKIRCRCGNPELIHPAAVCPVGAREDLGLLSTKVITDAGVTYIRDDLNNNAQDITLYNFHACGTGTTAEATTDTALVTESTTALNPDNTRATGTRSTPAGNQFRSVGTATFDASASITEHGLMSQAATGGGSLFDRSVFTAIAVLSGDSIQFTYTLTLSSGG